MAPLQPSTPSARNAHGGGDRTAPIKQQQHACGRAKPFVELVEEGRVLQEHLSVDYSRCIGEGAFASCFAATTDKGQQKRVVKVVERRQLSSAALRQSEREVVLHAQCQHAHICKLIGACERSDGALLLVLSPCVGNLGSAIAHGAPVAALAPSLASQLLLALQYLHDDLSVVHADIKPANVLLDEDGLVRLCDLGSAAQLCEGGRSTLVGSPAYTAPEVVAITQLGLHLTGATYSFAVDVWSLGVLLYEVLCGSLPFAAQPREPNAQMAAILFQPPPLEPK